jgi:hypothetical protein
MHLTGPRRKIIQISNNGCRNMIKNFLFVRKCILVVLPSSPRLTIGGGYSPGRTSAMGHKTRPNGTPVCFLISGLSGIVYIVERMKRGPARETNWNLEKISYVNAVTVISTGNETKLASN